MIDFISNINLTTIAFTSSICVILAGVIYKCCIIVMQDKREYNISNKFLVVPYKNIAKVEFKND